MEEDDEYYIPEIDTSLYDKYNEELTSLTLTLVKHSSERYVGFLLKFMTPIESNTKKQSTVKIFSSGKFNLDGCNTKEQAYVIKQILFRLMEISSDYILYRKL
jgi:TATA-box binding protein (TBP) (component of TFIID and TFIIIB)